jgi:cytochrome c oxidase assembly factor CtaG
VKFEITYFTLIKSIVPFNKIKKNLKSIISLTILMFLLIISFQEWILESLENELGYHMIFEHTMFFLIGYLSVNALELLIKFIKINIDKKKNKKFYEITLSQLNQYWILFLRKIFYKLNKKWIILFIFIVMLMSIWHVPQIFDFATFNPNIHLLQHFSFIIVGILLFVSIRLSSESTSIFYLLSSIGMMAFSGLILASTNDSIYTSYSIDSHHTSGNYMFLLTILIALVLFPCYLVHRTLFHIRQTTKNKE